MRPILTRRMNSSIGSTVATTRSSAELKTTAGAVRLTARLLLETGRTTEAVELLETLVARTAEPGSGSTSDPRTERLHGC